MNKMESHTSIRIDHLKSDVIGFNPRVASIQDLIVPGPRRETKLRDNNGMYPSMASFYYNASSVGTINNLDSSGKQSRRHLPQPPMPSADFDYFRNKLTKDYRGFLLLQNGCTRLS